MERENSAGEDNTPGKVHAAPPSRTRLRRAALALLISVLFFTGFVVVTETAVVTSCEAASGDPILPDWGDSITQYVVDGGLSVAQNMVQQSPVGCPCLCGPWGCIPLPSPCVFTGETTLMMEWLESSLRSKLASTAIALESFIGDWLISGMVATMLNVINQAELNLIDWWDTFWFYNLNPAMQDMTKQFSVGLMDQVRAVQTGLDVAQGGGPLDVRHRMDAKAAKNLQPSENVAVVATMVGGTQRASAIGNAFASALQNESHATGLNRMTLYDGTPNPAAAGVAATRAYRRQLYRNTVCDPNGNGGNNPCGDSVDHPEWRNADTQVTARLYAPLTIDLIGSSAKPPVSASAEEPGWFRAPLFIRAATAAGLGDTTLETTADPAPAAGSSAIPEPVLSMLLDNMLCDVVMDPIPAPALGTSAGRESYMERRSTLARCAAARSTVGLMVARRAPGSQIAQWVRELRLASGTPESEISPNPSYREIMHAMTYDRFNSGKYALSVNQEEGAVEQEKLMMNIVYLMQLRDYYELLERQAMTLAVQVSLLADQATEKLPEVKGR